MTFRKDVGEEAEAGSESERARWQTIMRRRAIDGYRQQRRWQRDQLSWTLNDADGDQWADGASIQAFDAVEWHLLFDQVLATQEVCVIDQLYWQMATQRHTAATCALSQTSVRRVHQQALRNLRRNLQ